MLNLASTKNCDFFLEYFSSCRNCICWINDGRALAWLTWSTRGIPQVGQKISRHRNCAKNEFMRMEARDLNHVQSRLRNCLCETVYLEHDCPELWLWQCRLLHGSRDSTLARVSGLLTIEDLPPIMLMKELICTTSTGEYVCRIVCWTGMRQAGLGSKPQDLCLLIANEDWEMLGTEQPMETNGGVSPAVWLDGWQILAEHFSYPFIKESTHYHGN